MRLRAGRGPSVRELVADHWRYEVRSPGLESASRVALLAQWSRGPAMTRSVCTLVSELQAYGYEVVVTSACETNARLEWGHGVDLDRLTVIRKPNVGYDFGSWSVALGALPGVWGQERVLLTNDSMAGPFVALRPLLEQFDRTPADVWGLTDSTQFGYHLQSYFIGFADGVLRDRPLRDFWARIGHETDKTKIIFRYEIGLGRLLTEEGYLQEAAFPHELSVSEGQNQIMWAWRELLSRGFPFVKREILRDPSVAPAGESVRAILKQTLDVDVDEWVEDRAS